METRREDYILWDAKRVWLKAKITLMKKYWFIKENFSREEMHKLWKLDLIKWYDIDAELENDVQAIAELEDCQMWY